MKKAIEADKAKEEAERIARETVPEASNAAESIQFGTQDDNTVGGVEDFVRTTSKASKVSTTGGSGLGFAL